MDELDQPRGAIDEIDRQLLALLARRMETVREIAAVKRHNREAPLRDAQRERRVFEFWSHEGHKLGLSSYFVGRILKELLAYSRRDQERRLDATTADVEAPAARVAYQGAPGSYSDLALEKLFASRAHATLSKEGHETFEGTLDALEAGEVDYALLPIENTIAGSIHDVYRELSQRPVVLVDEEIWQVEHCLAALPGVRVADLRLIRSHPVALQQCSRFLRGLVGARAESWYDTAAAAQSVAAADSSEVAAICSAEAARDLGLEVLRRDIADHAENHTRFVLVGLAGNHQVILCERGIRTFERATRSTLDVSAVPVLRERTHLPVIVDPSHAAGRRSLVIPLALAAAAAGADGLMVEAHPCPAEALCDAEQALTAGDLERLRAALEPLTAPDGRRI